MEISMALRDVKGGTEIDIMVTPNAKVPLIGDVDEWRRRLVVKVRAVPSEGRANQAVCELFEKALSSEVEIVHGSTNRHKTLRVPLNKEIVLQRLEVAREER